MPCKYIDDYDAIEICKAKEEKAVTIANSL
jgi:hypothetical protein